MDLKDMGDEELVRDYHNACNALSFAVDGNWEYRQEMENNIRAEILRRMKAGAQLREFREWLEPWAKVEGGGSLTNTLTKLDAITGREDGSVTR